MNPLSFKYQTDRCLVTFVPWHTAEDWFEGKISDGEAFLAPIEEREFFWCFVMSLKGMAGVREMLYKVGQACESKFCRGVICRTDNETVLQWLSESHGIRGFREASGKVRFCGTRDCRFIRLAQKFYARKKEIEIVAWRSQRSQEERVAA